MFLLVLFPESNVDKIALNGRKVTNDLPVHKAGIFVNARTAV